MSILVLATDCDSTWALVNSLKQHFPIDAVVIEQPVRRAEFLNRRVKRLGAVAVAGQVAFQMFSRTLAIESRHRRKAIIARNRWTLTPATDIARWDVTSVNDRSSIALIEACSARVIVVHGTRILSKRLLGSVRIPILNMHAGITPRYRGVHGGYWAYARNDAEHAGVTIHRVDHGIDTGEVVAQATIQRSAVDNFATYPWLQLEAGLPLLTTAVQHWLQGRLDSIAREDQSELFYHPTLWGYLHRRWTCGVK